MIKKFADSGGGKGGEFYTLEGVARVWVKIIKPQEAINFMILLRKKLNEYLKELGFDEI